MDPNEQARRIEIDARIEQLLQQLRELRALVVAQGQQLLAARSQ